MEKILIIDDDTYVCRQLEDLLVRQGYAVQKAYTANNGLKLLKKGGVGLVFCDYRLPDAEGMEVFRRMQKIAPLLPVVFMTAYADVRTAVKMMRAGAFDYITKPFLPAEIERIVVRGLKRTGETRDFFERRFVKGSCNAIQNVMNHVELVAPTDLSVLIEGETGSGKEFFARAIHYGSPRNNKPFVALDCGALPGELANSELFGHVRGAFTGAINDKAGCFEEAGGGTLFLDEVGNLSHENQVKLLRTLQEKMISRLGDNKSIPVDVRIIAATNEDLMKDVRNNTFREDLYHRINGFRITLPPLRDRKEDIFLFVSRFVEKANVEFRKNVQEWDNEVEEAFLRYPWPGNIRELENVINRCVLLSAGSQITSNTLPDEIRFFQDDHKTGEDQEATLSPSGVKTLKQATAEAERTAILSALSQAGYNKSRAARLLGVDRKTLYNKMREYSIRAG